MPALVKRKVVFTSNVVRPVRQHLRNNVHRTEHGGAAGQNLRTLLDVSGVRIPGLLSGTGLNDDFQSSFGEIGNDEGNKGTPPFPGIALFRNSDDHVGSRPFRGRYE